MSIFAASPVEAVLCFMFLLMILSVGVIASRVHWLVKATFIILTLVYGMIFYEGYVGALGWPVKTDPPHTFQYLGSMVHNPVGSDPGAIYLWLFDPSIGQQPRAIALPFSEQLRKMVSEAQRRMKEGQPIFMSYGSKPSHAAKGEGNGQSGGSESGGGRGSRGPGVNGKFIHIIPPPDTLPKKG